MEICLPTVVPEVTTTLSAALPLAIVRADNRTDGWYYENYIQLASMVIRGSTMVCYDKNIYSGRSGPLEREAHPYLPGTRSHNVVDEIVGRLRAGFHCAAQLDHYYLRCKKQYGRQHFPHQVLLYRWSDNEREFHAIGFDNRDVIAKLRLHATEVEESYHGAFDELCRADTHYGMSFLRLSPNFRGHGVRPAKILSQVKAFVSGEPTKETDLGTALELAETAPRFGLRVYEDVLRMIDKKMEDPEGVVFRVHVVHCLAEHKRLLLARLRLMERLSCRGGNTEERRKLVTEYQRVGNLFRTIELSYLRGAMRMAQGRGVYSQVGDVELLGRLRSRIVEAIGIERRILESVVMERWV